MCQIPTGFGKSHVLCLSAAHLLQKGKKVLLVFSNEYIMKRDVSLFSGIFRSIAPSDHFKSLSVDFKSKNFLHSILNSKEDWEVLVDEIDSAFFSSMLNMSVLVKLNARGVTATAV